VAYTHANTVQLKIYSVAFLALIDANSSAPSFKLMIFAISYSLLGQLSRERIWPSVLYFCHMYHRNIFHRVRNLLIIKILLLVAAPPFPLHPRQLPCLPTPHPGSDVYTKVTIMDIMLTSTV
jgi:hypothetical protein